MPTDSKPKLSADFATERVPDQFTVHGLRIAVVIVGIGATLPMFLLGAQLAGARGLKGAAQIIFLASALVGALGLFTSVVGAKSRLSTYQVNAFAFGRQGAKIVNLALGVVLIGWFATTASLLAASIQEGMERLVGASYPRWAYTLAMLTLMTVTGIFGFRVMERFVRVTVPLLIGLMLFVLCVALQRGGLADAYAAVGDRSLTRGDALSAVIGAIILTAVLAPDLTRYARDARHALLSVLGLTFGFPLVMILAAVPAALLGKTDILYVMGLLGLPGIAMLILVVSTWTSNTSNLYSATLTLATFFGRGVSSRILGLVAAVTALVAALCGIADHFVPLLIVLGVVSAPIAGVYVIDFFLVNSKLYRIEMLELLPDYSLAAFAAWIFGATVGLGATYSEHSVTGVPAVDSIVVAGASYYLATRGTARPRAVSVQ